MSARDEHDEASEKLLPCSCWGMGNEPGVDKHMAYCQTFRRPAIAAYSRAQAAAHKADEQALLEIYEALDGLPVSGEHTGPKSRKHLGAVEQIKALRAQAEKHKAEVEKLTRDRCDECGAKIYSGPPVCIRCGAPNCCLQCCLIESLRERLAQAEKVADTLEEEAHNQAEQIDFLTKEQDRLRTGWAQAKAKADAAHIAGLEAAKEVADLQIGDYPSTAYRIRDA